MQLVTHKFSVEDYHRMGEAGILPPDRNFELILGEIISKSPVGFKHAATVKRITAFCYRKFHAVVSIQDPILLGDDSEPEPDVVLLKMRDDFYGSRLPEASDVLLLIEVSDSTLRYDRQVKLPLYANNGIAEVWLVNLQEKQLEVYRSPTASLYQDRQILTNTDTVIPLAFEDVSLMVAELLG